MPAWLVLWVRYLWPLFGYTIPSFVVPRRSQGRGQRVCRCLKCQEKCARAAVFVWHKLTINHVHAYRDTKHIRSLLHDWFMKLCQFLQQRNRSMWNSRCFGALKFEHHYETVTCSRSSWMLLFITACCHECMNHECSSLLCYWDVWPLVVVLLIWAREEAENSKEVHRGAAIYFRNIRFER